MLRSFFEQVIAIAVNAFNTAIVAASRYPASASFIDASLAERWVFLIHSGTLNSGTSFQVKQDTSATETGSIKDVTGAVYALDPTTGDDQWFSIEVETSKLDIANGFRYLTLVPTGPAGGDDYADIIVLGLNPFSVPVTQNANYVASVVVAG